jgi:hypothetical protein
MRAPSLYTRVALLENRFSPYCPREIYHMGAIKQLRQESSKSGGMWSVKI